MPPVDFPFLLAQAAGGDAASGQGSALGTFLPLLAMIVPIYLLIIRPQQTQEKKRKEMISAIKKNDRVLTTAGIFGTVVSVSDDGDEVTLRVSDDPAVKMKFSKGAVTRVVDAAAPVEKEKAPEKS